MGHSLKGLAQRYVEPFAADTQGGLTEVFRKGFKRTKDTGWSAPGLTFNETYLRYAGLDVIYTARVMAAMGSHIRSRGLVDLLQWERQVQAATLSMELRGIRLDVDYTKRLVQDLHDEADKLKHQALTDYGVENINSTQQVADALIRSGVRLTAKTPSGNLSVGKDVLLPLAGLTPYWEPIPGVDPHPLANAVVRAKRAEKWSVAYAETFLALRDEGDRVHPTIKSLAARTGRMSVADPPLQQLPSGDWRIRRALIPDEGNVFISSDFSQIELRVIAGNARVQNMIDAIKNGVELHDRTADLLFGKGWSKRQRGIAKSVAFGYVYGGGPSTLSKTAGISYGEAKKVIASFERAYPELPLYNEKLQDAVVENGYVLDLPSGRQLPVNPGRLYSALNYQTQGGARDMFAAAMLDVLSLPGMSGRMSLVIHDEVLHQAPLDQVKEQAAAVSTAMQREYRGVAIAADSDIASGGSWGSLYRAPVELDRERGV